MPIFLEIMAGKCPYCGNIGFRIDFDELWKFDEYGSVNVQCIKCGHYGSVTRNKKCR